MKKHMIVALSAAAVSCVAAMQVRALFADKEVEGSYYGADGRNLDVLGVCSAGSDKLECWDMHGLRSAKISQRVLALAGGSIKGQVSVGRKNRIVLLGGSAAYQVATADVVFQKSETDATFTGVRVTSPVQDKSARVVATVYGVPVAAELPLRTGAKTAVGGNAFEVGAIGDGAPALEPRKFGQATPDPWAAVGKHWSTVVYAYRPTYRTDGSWVPVIGGGGEEFVPLDKDHMPIRYADLKGNPISEKTYLALGGPPTALRPKPRCAQARVVVVGGVDNVEKLSLNIDPAKIAFLKLTLQNQKDVLFKDIPLDPRE